MVATITKTTLIDPAQLIGSAQLKLPDQDEWIEKRAKRTINCLRSESAQQKEYQLCKADILHFIWYWCWLFNPWNVEDKRILLYLPYPFQELLALRLNKSIIDCSRGDLLHRENIILEKCRTMAASWTVLVVFLYRWMFFGDTFLLMSYKEDLVDEIGNMLSLFEKLRFMLRKMPEFLLPRGFDWKQHSKEALLINPNGGEIFGVSTTTKTGRAGRVNAVMYDELAFVDIGVDFSAWSGVSQTALCRIAVSTPNGPHNLFAKLAQGGQDWEEDREIITLHWYIHPVYAQGLELVSGKLTSPWYKSTKRSVDVQTFAREIEIDYRQSIKGTIFEQYGEAHQDDTLMPVRGIPIIVSIDPGTHWYTGFFQVDEWDRLLCLRELYFENCPGGIDEIGEKIQNCINTYFTSFDLEFCGDPAGSHVNSSMHKGKSEYAYLRENFGWLIHFNFMNHIPQNEWENARIRAIQARMTRMGTHGPSFVINTRTCEKLHGALAGNYRYQTEKDGEIIEKPERKHPWADAADVCGYVPIYRKMYQHHMGRKTKVQTRQVRWGDPSGARNWAN